MKLTKGKTMRGNCDGEKRQDRTSRLVERWGWLATVVVLAILLSLAAGRGVAAQAVTTTTVQGTVYLANGQPGAGTLEVSWPAFTTAAGKAVTAGKLTVTIGVDGFMSVNLAPNLGSTPAGLFYTAIYHMTDGTTSTEYWVVPQTAQAALGSVRAQVMPAAQAVQAVSKSYVDQMVNSLSGGWLPLTGGTLTGPLVLNADPTQPLQASDKHYVDQTFAKAVPLAGGNMTGALTTPVVNGVQSPTAASSQTTLQAAMTAAGTTGAMQIPPNYTGTDRFTNTNGVYVKDWRTSGAQQVERSVKEFGAVCDGQTDDTNALQMAINYANVHGVALTIPQGVCKTRTLSWHGESIGGLGKQVSGLKGYPGQDVLATATDSTNILSYTRLHDLTIYVDQSVDVSCSGAKGRAAAGSCGVSRVIENNSVFSAGANGLTATVGTGAGWYVGNCAIAMPAATGAGGNGLKVASIENVEIVTTGTDSMAASYAGAISTHTCGLYLGQWPRWSEFKNIDIRGVHTAIAVPALAGVTPTGLNADSNRWENITIQAVHGFAAAAGSNNVLDNVVAHVGNSSAAGETPTGVVLDLTGTQSGWTVRNAVVLPTWMSVQPTLTLTASGGAVTSVTVGSEHGLGFDPYGTSVPLAFSGSCTATANAAVNSDGSIGAVTLTQGGVGCSSTTTASVNVAGTWDTAAPVNLIGGMNLAFVSGNLLRGTGGYTVWNATSSKVLGTQVAGGGGVLPGGGSYAALVGTGQPGGAFEVDQFPGADFGAKLQACVNAVSESYGGTCDARNFTGMQSMAASVTIAKSNTAVLLPCATIATTNQLIVAAGARNVSLKGCSLRGGSQADGSKGGTAIAYSGSGAAVQVGDATYAADTLGFHMDNVVINVTGSSAATTTGLTAYRTQEMDLESLYFLGNANQTGLTLDGTGNYVGGTYFDVALNGFQTAVNAIGHQTANAATTDWMNASTFVRVHINCPTSAGSPIAGTYGINLQAGDGNTFTGGDVEGCATALHLGASAKNNTFVGVRNENSTSQVVADAGSAYNSWMTGGTMFTGALTDNGTRNSFLDTFHRSFNGMNGDWYGSQQDATVTNHYRLGTGTGNERGLLDRYQMDSGYRWTIGLSDATAGEQFYQVLDELNNVYRISVGQYNNGQSSTNAQTVINSAGTGAVVLNGSNNAGTGGVVIGSGGTSATTVAAIDKQGNTTLNGTLQVGGATTFLATPTVKNNANAEIDLTLWAGSTAAQKEALVYKDYTGTSQWYLVKDTANNLALNSAIGGLDSFKAYQSTNSGDTYVNASNSTGAVRVNYETGSGNAFNVYGGNSSSLYASFAGAVAIKFPGLAASTGHNCLQIDSSGFITNTGTGCGTSSASGTTISSGVTGQIAYYTANGNSLGGETTVPVAAGGTGAATAAAGLANLNGVSTALTTTQTMAGSLQAPGLIPATTPYADIRAYGAVIDGSTAIDTALANAVAAACTTSGTVLLPCNGSGCYLQNGTTLAAVNAGVACANSTVLQLRLQGKLILGSTFVTPDQMDLVGAGQGTQQTYQMSGSTAQIQAPAVKGTMGTAVSVVNAATTFTPTFTSGTVANLQAGTAITIAGTTSCTITSIARASNVVTATLSQTCAIPAGTVVTVAGVADATFNTTPMVTGSDYGAKTVSWQQSASDGTSSGGTVTGFNEATFETVRIQAVNGSVATAVFTHAHGAADQWGMVAIAPPTNSSLHHGFENINVTGNYGAGFWGEHTSMLSMKNMAFGETAAMTSIPVEMASAQSFRISRSTMLPTLGHGCTTNCGQQGYPYGFRCTGLSSAVNAANDGCAAGTSVIDDNSVIGAGIKLDTNGVAQPIGGLTVRDSVIEQPIVNALTEDLSGGSAVQRPVTFDHVTLQDSFMGYGFAWVNSLYPAAVNRNTNGFVASNISGALTANVAGKYFNGRILIDGADYAQGGIALPVGRSAPVGTIADGSITLTELDGMGGGLGASLIPTATQSVNTNAATWSCNNCTVRTAVQAPDGTATAAEINTTSGNGYTSVGGYTGSTAAGDCFLFGAWARAGQNQKIVTSDQGPMVLASAGGDVFDQGGSTATASAFQQNVQGNWWHPVVALSCLTTGSATSHLVDLRLYAGPATGTTVGNQFWNPFVVYVPATASVARNEVERWRQQLMHGVVPPGMPAGGGVLAMSAAHKLYWGNDTNLYRSAAGVVKTDGSLDVGAGYACQGSLGTAGQVLATTGSGCQWTAPGTSSFTGDGVVLGNSGTTGAVTATLKPVTPNQVLAGPLTGTQQGAPAYRALGSADLPASITSSTTGTAAGLSAASLLPNGTTASTQVASDKSTKVATTAYADNAVAVETARAQAAEQPIVGMQSAINAALPANGCTTSAGGSLTCNTITTGSEVVTGSVSHASTAFNAFQYPLLTTGPVLASGYLQNPVLSSSLGVDTNGAAQGFTAHFASPTILHGGMYSTQQMNQYSDYFAGMLSRSQGSHQLNGYYGVGLGHGDLIDHSGDLYCAGGAGNMIGGISQPACQFAQPVMGTWPFVFKGTLTSAANSSNVLSYTATQHESVAAGARALWDLSKTYNVGTATYTPGSIPGVVTFSGNADFTTMTPSPIGQLLILGSSSQGYAPSYNGTAGGAAGTFAGFTNPGAVYGAEVGNSGGSGYVTGNAVAVSGCGSGDAILYVTASGGVVTGLSLSKTPTGSSGYTILPKQTANRPTGSGNYSVSSNCATTTISGSGFGLTVNVTQVTGVVGVAGQTCTVNSFTGGSGATGNGSGSLTLKLTGPNTIALGQAFENSAQGNWKPTYNNVVNATGSALQNGSALCVGNVLLNPTTFPCQGDDVVIDGACWGHPQRVNAVLGPNQLQTENNYDSRLTSANTAGVPYALIPSLPLTDVDTQTHTATALGRLLTATVVSAGSSITPGTYLLNGSGGLGAGLQCSTPPTAPTSGNLQCAQIQVVVGATGTVTSVTPTVSGGPVYVSAPSFTMVSSSPALGGGVANCGSTCPTFQAYLDTANITAFQSGDTIAQPPDHRMAWNSTQAIYEPMYLDLGGGAVEKNLGPGQLYAAQTVQGDAANNLGGFMFGFADSGARLDYWSNFAGQALKYGMFYGPSSTFGSSIWDYNGVTAQMGTDFSGATFASKAMTGASQPSQQPALFLNQQQSVCAGNYGASCAAALSFKSASSEPLYSLSGSNPIAILSGLQGYYSFAVTDHANSALAWTHGTGTLTSQAAVLSGGTTYTSVVDSLSVSGGAIVRSSTPLTNFLGGIKLASGQSLTSTDGVGSQVVTKTPSGTIAPAEMCGSAPAASGYYCDGYTKTWTAFPAGTYTATESACQAGTLAKPCNVAHLSPTTYSGTTTQSTTMYTPTTAGVYRLCGGLNNTVAATTGTSEYLNPSFTSSGHYQGNVVTASISTPTTQWSYASGCSMIYADASTVITQRLVFNSVTGTPTTVYWSTLEWLQ